MVDQVTSTTPSRRSSTATKSPTTPPPQEDNPISKKVSEILLNPIDDMKVKIALEALSEFYSTSDSDYSIIARRNLRGNIEQKSIETNKNFLDIFGKITEVELLLLLSLLIYIIANFLLAFSSY